MDEWEVEMEAVEKTRCSKVRAPATQTACLSAWCKESSAQISWIPLDEQLFPHLSHFCCVFLSSTVQEQKK